MCHICPLLPYQKHFFLKSQKVWEGTGTQWVPSLSSLSSPGLKWWNIYWVIRPALQLKWLLSPGLPYRKADLSVFPSNLPLSHEEVPATNPLKRKIEPPRRRLDSKELKIQKSSVSSAFDLSGGTRNNTHSSFCPHCQSLPSIASSPVWLPVDNLDVWRNSTENEANHSKAEHTPYMHKDLKFSLWYVRLAMHH